MTHQPANLTSNDDLQQLQRVLERLPPFSLSPGDETVGADSLEAVQGGAGNPIPRGMVEVVGRIGECRVATLRPSSAEGPFEVSRVHAQRLRELAMTHDGVSKRERAQLAKDPLCVEVLEVHRSRLDVRAETVAAAWQEVRHTIERLRSRLPGDGVAWSRLETDDLLRDETVEPVRVLLRRAAASEPTAPPAQSAGDVTESTPSCSAPGARGGAARSVAPNEIRRSDITDSKGRRVPPSTVQHWRTRGLMLDGSRTPTMLVLLDRLPGGEGVFDREQVARFVAHSERVKAEKGPAL